MEGQRAKRFVATGKCDSRICCQLTSRRVLADTDRFSHDICKDNKCPRYTMTFLNLKCVYFTLSFCVDFGLSE
jgi:hypothetical protein